ncbi:MAG: cation:proton antiporter, partial [Spirochaetes bacterium]|nr:cation:proton antiporter [Spirochaetota bacterium]
MNIINELQSLVHNIHLPALLIVGIMTFIAFYFGKSMKYIKLPSIMGFMIIGLILGPSLFDLLDENVQNNFSFITEIALSFVALSIGIELSFASLKKQGISIIIIIIAESFLAFFMVTTGIYLLTGNLPMALIFGAIAPASAPAGTVAVIREYKAKGSLTQALYAVVGFDDGLGIIIFGFASAIAQSLISGANTTAHNNVITLLSKPLLEVGLSIAVGIIMAYIFSLLAKKLKGERDIFILLFSFVL